jgi:hypothetical protein
MKAQHTIETERRLRSFSKSVDKEKEMPNWTMAHRSEWSRTETQQGCPLNVQGL